MKQLLKKPWVLAVLSFCLSTACTKDYDFDKLSGNIEYDPAIDAPIVWGSLTAEDMFARWDSLMENKGDTVVLVFRDDSLFYFDARDFSGVMQQDTSEFNLESSVAYPFMPSDSIAIDSTDIYSFNLENNMRIDSLFINEGFLMIEVSSSFRHAGMLTIDCPEIYINGQVFHKKIQISSTDGSFYQKTLYPLENAKIYVNNTVPGEGSVQNIYHLVLYNNPGQGISIGDRVQIHFSLVDLDKFEVLFGFAGNDSYSVDTTISTGLGEISGISGSFSVTDPRINITYVNTFGLPVGIDMQMRGLFNDGHSVLIDPAEQFIEASDDYLQPVTVGSLQYNRTTIPNIHEFLTFPTPDSLVADGEARGNPGVSDARNFVLNNSAIQVGIEIEVPLAFEADLQLRDTFRLNVEKVDAVDYVEYANLHYRIRNEFPVQLDPYIILYDSVADVNLDTILFDESLSAPFIPAAPVDENGVTIVSQVEEITGVIRLDASLMDNFFGPANKMIMVGSFGSYQNEHVVILTTYNFDFKVNLEAKIHYKTNINDSSSND
ncbi:MAG: hypothetical protein JXR41_13990 [Bacteroidales bacterium]|nr:hypothetical protein [Bacteroidales bacterium]MBN2764199.1 hypothetical protein [Bacteroidales bacterium]